MNTGLAFRRGHASVCVCVCVICEETTELCKRAVRAPPQLSEVLPYRRWEDQAKYNQIYPKCFALPNCYLFCKLEDLVSC